MVYPFKKNGLSRVGLLVTGVALLAFGLGIPVLVLQQQPGWPPNLVDPRLLLPPLMAGLSANLLWAFFSATCEIRPPDLLINFGLLRWRIPLAAITEARPKRGLSSDWGWSVALSLDRVVIKYRTASGRRAMPVILSPQNKFGFLLELAEAVPALQPCADGTLRLPSEAVVAE
jgi:hypothetical protein